MKVLIYSINYSPELTGIGKYNGELAEYLIINGIDLSVLTAPPYYPDWRVHSGHRNCFNTGNEKGIQLFRCPMYIPSKVTTLKRLFHLASFAVSSALRLFSLASTRPHVVFMVQPTLFCAPATLLYCKLTGAKSVMHIQDFEVDAMFGLGLGKRGFVHRLAKSIESWLLKRFDVVSSISYSMLNNASKKGVDDSRLLFFPNWSDTNFVTPEVDGSEIRKSWGYSEDDKVVLYAGNIGQKQGLELVLDAARHFISKTNIKFLIIGNGAYAETLKSLAQSMQLDNIEFKPLQPWETIPAILSMADVHLVVQKRGAADAVLPSKLTNILSAGGHALVTAEPHTELGMIADKHPGIYTLVQPESSDAFIAGLDSVLAKKTTSPNLIARQYAVEYLAKDQVIDRFIKDIHSRIAKNSENLGKTHAN